MTQKNLLPEPVTPEPQKSLYPNPVTATGDAFEKGAGEWVPTHGRQSRQDLEKYVYGAWGV